MECTVRLRRPHPRQQDFMVSPAKRKIIRAGRRSGKTTGIAIYAVQQFLAGKRVLYATPTADQIERFWHEITLALADPIASKALYKNETKHSVSLRGTEMRIRAKTAWNADTLRGDFADLLILDEWQLMNEDAWEVVGAPMLLDNDGDAVFIYTPPSLRTASVSKARDPRHAAKMFLTAQQDTTGRWAAFHFSSHDNPHISQAALHEITRDMTRLAYRQEILAEDLADNPGALWQRPWLEVHRVTQFPPLARVVVAVDPTATSTGDACGIVVVGVAYQGNAAHLYVLDDVTTAGSPETWGRAVIAAYHRHRADLVVAEGNNGGEMVTFTLRTIDPAVPVKLVHASRGKAVRAEPVSALYEQGRGHHVGTFSALEDELCQWQPGDASPNRLDALVWAATELALSGGGWSIAY